MITSTALTSTRLLQAVKNATEQAVRLSNRQVCPFAAVWIRNRRNEPSFYVQAGRGRHVRYYDTNGRNITDTVLQALREWHA